LNPEPRTLNREPRVSEEKDCLEKYHRKWDQLDPNADQEKARAHEAQAVKETAEREVERLSKLRQGMREVLHRCRRVIEYFGISVDAIERGALIEEWDKKRVRVYKVFLPLPRPVDGAFPYLLLDPKHSRRKARVFNSTPASLFRIV